MSLILRTKAKTIDLLVFDLDGTLVDTKKDIAVSANFALQQVGCSPVPETVVHSYVGKGISNLMEGCLGEGRPRELEECVRLFREHYGAHLTVHSRLYSGVLEVLSRFYPKKKAILSNKIESFSKEILKQLGVLEKFDVVWGGDTGDLMKPDPTGLNMILLQLKVDRRRALFIGDSTVDIETGKNAGVQTCAVSYGFDSKEKLRAAEPDYLVDQIDCLLELFK